jgi:type II secretory pathway pseudopilin PulG
MEHQTPVTQASENKTNTLAIVGLIFSILLPLLGFILSIISLNQIKKRGEDGKSLAIAGIIISSMFMVIGLIIIPALVLTTFSGVQNKARDSERKSDINSMNAQFESYYVEHSYYPTYENLNDQAWRAANLSVLSPDAMQDPQGTEPKVASTPASSKYAYAPLGVTGQSCDNLKVPCVKYTLTATLEAGGTYQKKSLN